MAPFPALAQYAVLVTPKGQPVTVNPGVSTTQTFTVQNTGGATANFSLSATCNSPLVGCSQSATSINLTPGQSGTVNVTTTAGGDGTNGQMTLQAMFSSSSGFTQDIGVITIQARSPVTYGVTVTPKNQAVTVNANSTLTFPPR